ncbi:MAG: DUF1523 family protein [Paracoccaceae bacterium]
MWNYIKWGLRIFALLAVFLFFHYVLPQHDIVRVTNTYNRLTTIGMNAMFYSSPDAGTVENGDTRDIRFIESVRPNGKVIVYRNEDTGWVWPPYFKYDSSNLQAEASNLKSSEEVPKWAVMTHYGWRLPFLSIYPNAVGIKQVESPDVRIIPWVNIIILLVLAFLVLMVRRMWAQFRERSIDPVLEDMGEVSNAVQDHANGIWARFSNWLDTWRGKPGK